jgi:hypothetical protein
LFFVELDRVAKVVSAEKSRALERYDKELRKALRLEIIERMKGEKAAIQASLKDDTQVQVASALLKNRKVYDKLLSNGKK